MEINTNEISDELALWFISELQKPSPGFYCLQNEPIPIYCNRRNLLGYLHADSEVEVTRISTTRTWALIDYPIHNVWVRCSDLRKRTVRPSKSKIDKENEVMNVKGFWCDLYTTGKALEFVRRFFQQCEQDLILDLSYNPNAPISEFVTAPPTKDFREFKLQQQDDRVGIYINLPWYFKHTLVEKIKEIIADANKRNVEVDILVVHMYSCRRKKFFKELVSLCEHYWVLKEKFERPSGERTYCGEAFYGYITTRPDDCAERIVEKIEDPSA